MPTPWIIRAGRTASLALIAVFCANALTMILGNILGLSPHFVPLLFATFAGATLFLLRGRLPASETRTDLLTPREWRIATFVLFVLTIAFWFPRVPYLVEVAGRPSIQACYDDLWHFQELNSVANTPTYPAVSSFVPGKFLQFYYAAWMLPVAIYRALPVHGFTLHAAYSLADLFYVLCTLLSAAYMMYTLAKDRLHLLWAGYLTVFYAGLSSLFFFLTPWRRLEWWMTSFGFNTQFSSLSVLMLWVIHHVTSAMALLLLWFAFVRTEREWAWSDVPVVAALLAYAFYASAFVFIGAFPLIVALAIVQLRKKPVKTVTAGVLSLLLAISILWLYLSPQKDSGFQIARHRAHLGDFTLGWIGAFVLYLLLVVLNFAPQIRGAVIALKNADLHDRLLVSYGLLFLLSTFFIGYEGANNFCLRSTILPIVLLTWISAKYLPSLPSRTIVCIAAVIFSLASFQTMAMFNVAAFKQLTRTNITPIERRIVEINRDRSSDSITDPALHQLFSSRSDLFYYLSKLTNTKPQLPNWEDEELIGNGPTGHWSWQKRQ